MFRRRELIPLMGLLTLLSAAELAYAQRGRGGGRPGGGMARPGGGGMARPGGGGGMARPGGMTRPSMPQNRPAMSRPSMSMNRPNMGNMAQNRPNMGNMARPNMPQSRPNLGNMQRPSTRPGGIGGGGPGLGGNRPSTLPAQIGGNRPGLGGGNRPGLGGNRPTPLPGPIGGNRPGQGGNRPGLGGNRPTPLPGPIGGNRPGQGGGNGPGWAGNRPGGNGGGIQWPGGGGNRPGWAGNRPGGNGGGTQWPGGAGNRPGWANNRPGWGNGNGNNWGNNRPGWGNNRPGWGNENGNNWGIGNGSGNGNWGIGGGNNIGSGNTVINNNGGWGGGGGYSSGYNGVVNNVNVGGGWGGGGWGGGGWGGGGWGGGWGGNNFWAGFGTGALTSFGLGALGSVFGGGLYGYPSYYSGYGVYDYFPTWGVGNYNSWGLGSMANNWLYSGYTNPYYSTLVATQPAQTTVVYDYSQPINVTAASPNPATESSSEQVFSAAQDAFKAGDFQRALDLTDQVLKDAPNVPAVHEFRALCLFALKRFDEAAAVDYAVLSSGPGLNWSTLVSLYPDVDTYTNQLRALEASVRSNANSPAIQFLLGYHYLVQGHQEAAASQFKKVAKLQPTDQLSASFVKALKKVSEHPTAQSSQANVAAAGRPAGAAAAAGTAPAQPTAEQPQQPEAPPRPPASLVGTWKSQPSPDLSIALTLQADGQFAWEVDSKGQKQTLTGQAGFKDNTLALLQEDGPPLVGKIAEQGGTKFVFTPTGDQKAPGITFTKS